MIQMQADISQPRQWRAMRADRNQLAAIGARRTRRLQQFFDLSRTRDRQSHIAIAQQACAHQLVLQIGEIAGAQAQMQEFLQRIFGHQTRRTYAQDFDMLRFLQQVDGGIQCARVDRVTQ